MKRILCTIVMIALISLTGATIAQSCTVDVIEIADSLRVKIVDLLWWLNAGDTRMYDWNWPWDDDDDDLNGWEIVV